jgi:hypothetical protein
LIDGAKINFLLLAKKIQCSVFAQMPSANITLIVFINFKSVEGGLKKNDPKIVKGKF